MLQHRIITASIIASVFVGLGLLTPWYCIAALFLLVLALGTWEWSGLANINSQVVRVIYSLSVTVFSVFMLGYLHWGLNVDLVRHILLLGCVGWAISFLWVQAYPTSAILWRPRAVRLGMGYLFLFTATLAALYLVRLPDGSKLLLLVVALVASMDIGGYFFGRAFGKHKLAPLVSPGKTWEGVVGGLLCCFVVGFLGNAFLLAWPWSVAFVAFLFIGLAAVAGDLLESMLKREAGVKDSGRILPGHGGVLDRVDGLIAALPLFGLIVIATS